MATTSIWSIKTHLKQSILYIINPSKTTNKDFFDDYIKPLELYDYTEYNFIKEKEKYVSFINCGESSAFEEMDITKKRFCKENGVLGYHAYQSFNEGEVTADIAHEIGVKLANEIFGSEYEVVVATHQNTKHIHNHFIINSVSFLDGKKYNNNRTNLSKLRHISDSLCKEYNLGVLKEKDGYFSTFKNKVLSTDYYNILKQDVDMVISESLSMKQFRKKLEFLGYHSYCRYGIITVWKEGFDKVRLEQSFGSDYSYDKINEKFYNSRYVKYEPLNNKEIYNKYYLSSNKRHKGIYGLYLYYYYLIKTFPKKQYLSYEIRKDIKIMDKLSLETRFLVNNKIETIEDLLKFKKDNYEKLNILKSKRENLWRKYHKINDESIFNEIQNIKVSIKELYENDRYCKDILKRSKVIEKNINEIDSNYVFKDKSKERS